MINQENVLIALSRVPEPDLKKDLVTLNMIQDIKIDGQKISFTIVLTTPACPLKELIHNNCVKELKADFGEDIEVNIHMTSNVSSTRNKDINILPNVKNIVCISSGKGGVGKSTVTVQLALALSKMGAKVGILDADIHGPSIPIMLGMKNKKPQTREIKEKIYIQPVEYNDNLKVLSIGFLIDERQAIVWRGPMVTSALKQFINDVLWGDLDYLILDMPPGTGDVQLTIAQTLKVTCAVIVSTPQKVAIADARKALSMYRVQGVEIPVAGVIENMAYFVPHDMPDKKYYIFGSGGAKNLASDYEVAFLGEVPLTENLRECADNGQELTADNQIVLDSFQTIAQKLAREISVLNSESLVNSVN
ncbi:MAG: Mrp/NBP35 family ATP-binding protein [Chitinophagales bacterium]|nr:Mrp/NBP35 family ATP-binding protein [Chitinophagales bacterium]